MFDPKPILKNLPNLPGVYRMINATDEVIYVGKAKDLKKRVSSYFNKNLPSPRTRMMVSNIVKIETTVTHNEAEALLLENNLIKGLMPRYNVLFRDDKSYPYITLTGDAFPRLAFHRGSQRKGSQYFGPFPNSVAVRESIQLLQKVFKLRTCENTVFANRSRPCLQHQIERCTAPCVGLISDDHYRNDVHQAALFLQGKTTEVMDTLAEQMNTAAANQEYEMATVFRDRIQALRQVQAKQFVSDFNVSDADVIACAELQGQHCINLVMIRGGRHLGDRSYMPKNTDGETLETSMAAFLAQHYVAQNTPPLIVVGVKIETEIIVQVLSEQAGRKVKININAIGDKRVWLKMAQTNAELALGQRAATSANQAAKLVALREALHLLDTTERIECFDISHTMGEATVASCVVFDRGDMQNSEYRRYNITGITPGDDYAAMRDVLTRRYKKLASGEGARPDLVFIDGGKGQLGIAVEVMAEVGLDDILLVGIAKGEDRKPGLETMIFSDTGEMLNLEKDNKGLHLLQQIRDEAHRFAITGHRAKRAKARLHSSLEDIEGIGAKRRKALLTRFGGLDGVKNASIDEIANVEGISQSLAEKIYGALH
ncbi:MAG: excinuclease ABC subunit UvrC [Methylotenera sp.]|uniref:excinuclease ABC subunit UvrC n=1 Tax=Methylotenera sp. TaxID=2051956 RepID=UPI002723D16F|nr:excinuclease ABC subunit UvrC [Methylotenera sp.]MDO9050929.1 excinuclease ABC subunit UvrC [Methylotenera sp.]MDO9233708.1 excinuclease ABC subunit UvrC [Methylotenera sp.]MDO9390066.1 excinuclease ABC subunit UvrC [Methylotenera sp.]MDP2103179.1 excinuclease ABC subunit UvrC [Methylotenera sp.]MDP2230328.1 excinuclease ABC subunit UvrC [Methylotenera sp.]